MSFRSRSISAFALAAALGLGACADSPTSPTAAPTDGPLTSQALKQPGIAKYEIEYMQFTINHHMGGVALASLCLERATRTELRQLCATARSDQLREIGILRGWLRDWYGINYEGMILPEAQANVARLRQIPSVEEFQNQFLDTFSMGHLQIIEESLKATRRVRHEALDNLAESIVTSQSNQVIQMQTWDCQWYGECDDDLLRQAEKALKQLKT